MMNDADITKIWMASLVYVDNKIDAITIHIARTFGISPIRYNELATAVMNMIESTSGPREFFEMVDSERKNWFLNDAESVVFGAMLSNALIKLPDSVLYGKELANANGLNYDGFMQSVKEHEKACRGKMVGENGQ